MSVVSGELNPNLQFSEVVVGGLADAGLQAVCIAPGSRSTPLALAFDAHPCIETFVHLDERCASFFALGMSQASGRPVAMVCTSGTAAMEFHAAVVEAKMAGVPLLVLTADRPPELRHSGANQTIDQVKMYGDYVLWAVDAALPGNDAPEVALRDLRTLAARSYAVADGLRKGPVHINFPFRKPLEPEAPYRPRFDSGQGCTIGRGVLVPTLEQVEEMVALVSDNERGWIVCGPWAGRPPCGLVSAIAALGRSTGYPIFADPLSGLRFWAAYGVIAYHGQLRELPAASYGFRRAGSGSTIRCGADIEVPQRISDSYCAGLSGSRALQRRMGGRQPPSKQLLAGGRSRFLREGGGAM